MESVIYMYIVLSIFVDDYSLVLIYSTPPPGAGCNTGKFLQWSPTGLFSELSFSKTGCWNKVKEPYLHT